MADSTPRPGKSSEKVVQALRGAVDTLRRTADKLAEVPALEAFLEQVLSSLVETFGGSGGSLWWGDDQRVTLSLELAHGVMVRTPHGIHPHGAGLKALLQETPDVIERMHSGMTTVLDAGRAALSRASRDWVAKLGVRCLLVVPLVLGERHYGCLSVRMSEARAFGDEEIELARALATQAALAMELTRLAEQAKDKATAEAVASERESAALTRAAKLTEANAALKRSLDVLASDADLDGFLGGILREIGKRLNAQRVLMYLEADDGRGVEGRLGWSASIGVQRTIDKLVGPDAARGLLDAVRASRTRRLPFVQPATRRAGQSEAQVQHLHSAGVQAILHLPLVLGDRCLGAVAVLLGDSESPPTEDLELAHAFAHQATLALHLARLSTESRSVAVLQERARLAGEIHDGIAQSFIGISMQLNRARTETSPALDRALELAEHGLAEARRAVQALRPLHLVGKKFPEAVADMAQASVGQGATVSVSCSGIWEGLSADIETHLFRIVQEAVNNVVKHADATELSIELSAADSEISILVSDNGTGFDVQAHREAEHGFGLFSMRQRADGIGATLTIVSAPGRGTQVFASLPRPSSMPTRVGP